MHTRISTRPSTVRRQSSTSMPQMCDGEKSTCGNANTTKAIRIIFPTAEIVRLAISRRLEWRITA